MIYTVGTGKEIARAMRIPYKPSVLDQVGLAVFPVKFVGESEDEVVKQTNDGWLLDPGTFKVETSIGDEFDEIIEDKLEYMIDLTPDTAEFREGGSVVVYKTTKFKSDVPIALFMSIDPPTI